MAIIDFVNENRPKYDENGNDIKYLNEEYGFEPKNKFVMINLFFIFLFQT